MHKEKVNLIVYNKSLNKKRNNLEVFQFQEINL